MLSTYIETFERNSFEHYNLPEMAEAFISNCKPLSDIFYMCLVQHREELDAEFCIIPVLTFARDNNLDQVHYINLSRKPTSTILSTEC